MTQSQWLVAQSVDNKGGKLGKRDQQVWDEGTGGGQRQS